MRILRSAWLLIALLKKTCRLLLVFLAFLLIGGFVDYRNPRPSRVQATSAAQAAAPHMTPSELQTFTLFAELWRTEGDFVSTIRIKNSLITGPLNVTPVLYLADGTEYDLPSVDLATAGVAVVNVNDALSQVRANIAPHLSQHGSAALCYQYTSPGHVAGSVQILSESRSLSYVYSFAPTRQGSKGRQVIDGLWWRRDPGVGGFVSLASVADEPVRIAVQAIGPHGGRAPPESLQLTAHSTAMLGLDHLTEGLPETENRQGGIRVEYVGEPGAVLVAGGLANEEEGYSANMPFCPHEMMASSRPATYTFASVGLMVGQPDPMMGFPAGTTFAPYAVVRNTRAGRLTLRLALSYMVGSQPVTRTVAPVLLDSWEARQLDVRAMMKSAGLAGFRGNLNVTLSYFGLASDLMVATGSVDRTGTYVFAVEPQGIGPSSSKEDSYWTVADGWDTMISLWNPERKAQDFTLTFYYADGSGQYLLPVHLEGEASTMIDMMQLISAQHPDPEGHVIPTTVQTGSAVLSSAQGVTHRMTLAVSAATFNVVTATCCTNKVYCYGYTNPSVTPSGYCAVGKTMQCTAQAVYNNGSRVPVSGCTWSSSNTGIATVNSSGLMTGVSAGSVTITAQFPTLEAWSGVLCPPQTCPTWAPSAGAPETIQKPSAVEVIGNGTVTLACTIGGKTTNECQRQIRYQVFDGETPAQPIQLESMLIREYIHLKNDQCKTGGPTAGSWYTDATGAMPVDNPDGISTCSLLCNQGTACTEEWYQKFTVYNLGVTYPVSIVNGTSTGPCNDVATPMTPPACASCPTVSVVSSCPNPF